jgi:hypothetical protein
MASAKTSKTSHPSKPEQTTSAGKVPRDATPPTAIELTPAERRRIEALRDRVNGLAKHAGEANEEASDLLFSELYGDDVRAALDTRNAATPAYRVLQSMAGDTLVLDRTALSRSLRIGALNAHFRVGAWRKLGWTAKITVLPLLGIDVNLRRLELGIAQAVKLGGRTAPLRAWMAEQVPAEQKAAGRPVSMTLPALERLLESGGRLRTVASRRLVADKLRRQGAGAVKERLVSIARTIEALQQLREELAEQ